MDTVVATTDYHTAGEPFRIVAWWRRRRDPPAGTRDE